MMNVSFSNSRYNSIPINRVDKELKKENKPNQKLENLLNSYSAITEDRYGFNRLTSGLNITA